MGAGAGKVRCWKGFLIFYCSPCVGLSQFLISQVLQSGYCQLASAALFPYVYFLNTKIYITNLTVDGIRHCRYCSYQLPTSLDGISHSLMGFLSSRSAENFRSTAYKSLPISSFLLVRVPSTKRIWCGLRRAIFSRQTVACAIAQANPLKLSCSCQVAANQPSAW